MSKENIRERMAREQGLRPDLYKDHHIYRITFDCLVDDTETEEGEIENDHSMILDEFNAIPETIKIEKVKEED